MENNQPTNMPPMGTIPTNNTQFPSPQKNSMSGMIGTIIIIALIVLGGLYFWGKRINTQKDNAALINQEQMANQQASLIQAVSTSDETSTLEAELSATQTTNLGTELE